MKIFNLAFLMIVCSLFFVVDVSAKEISQFCDYTESCLTTQKVDNWIENSGIDTTVYDSYYITVITYFSDYYFSIVFYKYQDMLNKNIVISESSYFTHLRFNTSHYRYTKTLSNTQKFSLSDVDIKYYTNSYSLMFKGATSSDTEQVILAYYSNKDILDNDGNIILKANIEIEDEEDPIISNNRNYLEKFINFSKEIYSIVGELAKKVINTPLLALPFGLCVLVIVIAIFYKLFTRR